MGERELRLFPNCVTSIVQATAGRNDVELVVSDWESDDWPLVQWLAAHAAPLPVRVVTAHGEFSRGRGRNLAAEAAKGEILFFLDADCLLSRETLESGLRAIADGAAYFPIVFTYSWPDSTAGEWHESGYGNCLVTRASFYAAGQWPEYTRWGQEDPDFYESLLRHVSVVRDRPPGLIHQWHPTDTIWKDSFDQDSRQKRITELAKQHEAFVLGTLNEIYEILKPSASVILVDQCEWDRALLKAWKPLPFLEKDGEYWGPPEDSTVAIDQLERLRRQGATAIVFVPPAFWWLDYYDEFLVHLNTNYRRLRASGRVLAFDLQTKRSTQEAG